MAKAYQLRVRLDDAAHQKLLELSSTRGKGETLSDLVRDAINRYVGHSTESENCVVSIDQKTHTQLSEFAGKLDRKMERVLEDCVQGIVDNFESERPPLIVLELRLREKYFSNKQRA